MPPSKIIAVTLKGPDVQRITSRSIEDLPFDILDRIFSLLKSHRTALFACSKAHPILSQVIERYRFHHITISTAIGFPVVEYSFDPGNLRRQLEETPHIVKYVAVLEIEFIYRRHEASSECFMAPIWEEIAALWLQAYLEVVAPLLPMFPVLECIILPTLSSDLKISWQKNLPQCFRTALESCLRLPTLQEVQVGDRSFPLSMLDNYANITSLALSAPPIFKSENLAITYPQLKSLALERFDHHNSSDFPTWAKRHISGLQSLKYDFSCHAIILKVVEICSATLENLYLCLHRHTPDYCDLINLSSLPHLRHLTIHTEIYFTDQFEDTSYTHYLRIMVTLLESASSLQQLTIEIYIDPSSTNLGEINALNLSPLGDLTKYSICFPRIDLYMYTGSPRLLITRTIMASLLAKQGLMTLVEQGVLAFHAEETAPTLSRSYVATENNTCIIIYIGGVREWMPARAVSPLPRRHKSFASMPFVSSGPSIEKFGEGVDRMWEKSWTRKGRGFCFVRVSGRKSVTYRVNRIS